MSLGNFPLLLSHIEDIEDTKGLNILTKYNQRVHPHGDTLPQGMTINYALLTSGAVKILYINVLIPEVHNPGTNNDIIDDELDQSAFEYNINAISLVSVDHNFPENEESGIVASGEIIPYNGQLNVTDPLITHIQSLNPNVSLSYTAKDYLSGNEIVLHSQDLFKQIENLNDQGLQIGIYTGPSTAYDNTFNPETKDLLAYDHAANTALWIPEDDLVPDSNAPQAIAQASQIKMPFGFNCGAVIMAGLSTPGAFPVELVWNPTSSRYDTINYDIPAGTLGSGFNFTYIVVGV